MDVTIGSVWLAISLAFVAAIITKVARDRILVDPVCNRLPPPPVVNCFSLFGLIRTLFSKGLKAMIFDQYTRLGSVFTVSLVGVKLTFLIGPEVSDHFYQGLDSEVSPNMLEFTVPMIKGKDDVDYDIEERKRIFNGALKISKLSSQVGPMLQEVEEYLEKWGLQGTVDLRQELENLFTLVTGRCLIGREVQELDEFFPLFNEMMHNGTHLASVLFPYAATPITRRRDRARAKLSEILTKIVRSRKNSKQDESDVLQRLIDSKFRDGRPMTESEVAGMIIALLMAAMHTSFITSVWTGACMLSDERFLAASNIEQKQIIRKYGDRIDYNALQEMDTLHCCIKEALRMHPPMPALFRMVHKDFIVQTKEGVMYKIPRGHTIISPTLFSNSIPSIYKDPDLYDPERFGAGREEDRVGGRFSFTTLEP